MKVVVLEDWRRARRIEAALRERDDVVSQRREHAAKHLTPVALRRPESDNGGPRAS